MQEQHTYDYAVIRAVPRVERGEFVNVGVIIWCAPQRFLKALVSVDTKKILALDPKADVEAIQKAVASIPIVCKGGTEAGDLGKLALSERFNWLVAPRSTSVQTSPVHIGRGCELDQAIEKIFNEMVR
ncbi:DUF3037 domain-containing protein [bacterium]|nr:DUF3037 domain-containing protein [bacterium]